MLSRSTLSSSSSSSRRGRPTCSACLSCQRCLIASAGHAQQCCHSPSHSLTWASMSSARTLFVTSCHESLPTFLDSTPQPPTHMHGHPPSLRIAPAPFLRGSQRTWVHKRGFRPTPPRRWNRSLASSFTVFYAFRTEDVIPPPSLLKHPRTHQVRALQEARARVGEGGRGAQGRPTCSALTHACLSWQRCLIASAGQARHSPAARIVFTDLGIHVQGDTSSGVEITLASVDATIHKPLGERFDVKVLLLLYSRYRS